MLPGGSKTSALTIVVQVARADYWSRACLFSHDDVFQCSFRLTLIGRRPIALSRDATPVYQFRFQVGGIFPTEIAPLRNSIRCRFRRATFYLEESPLPVRGREYWVTRWGVSCLLESHAVLLLVSPWSWCGLCALRRRRCRRTCTRVRACARVCRRAPRSACSRSPSCGCSRPSRCAPRNSHTDCSAAAHTIIAIDIGHVFRTRIFFDARVIEYWRVVDRSLSTVTVKTFRSLDGEYTAHGTATILPPPLARAPPPPPEVETTV